ncbi:MAG: metallophosphoesterase family protein [Actinomycetota bacterium]
MRILHTADWHVGKRLGRIDRTAEFEQALDEVVAIAADQKVDVVIVAGDLLDRALPPLDCIRLVIDALLRLAAAAGTVVAIPGNHDSAALFSLLAPLLAPQGVILAPYIRRPDQGGVLRVPSRDGTETASVAVFPFLHEAQVVDFMEDEPEWFKGYADRVRGICTRLCSAFDPSGVGILVGHYFVDGAQLGGGERTIHVGRHYAATAQAIPPGAHYVALGHIHRPQEIPGAAVPARYSGSLLQLDFSERTHRKEVVVVDAAAGRRARVTSVPLASGRQLIRLEDTLEALKSRADSFGVAYLDVRVQTAGPVFGLSETVRSFLPNAVFVQAVYERVTPEIGGPGRADRSLTDAYAEFHASPVGHGVAAPAALLDALRSIEDEVARETP